MIKSFIETTTRKRMSALRVTVIMGFIGALAVSVGVDAAELSWYKWDISSGADAKGRKPIFKPLGYMKESEFKKDLNGEPVTVYIAEADSLLGGHIKMVKIADRKNSLVSYRLTIDRDQKPRGTFEVILKNGFYHMDINNPKQKLSGVHPWREKHGIVYANAEKHMFSVCTKENVNAEFLTITDQDIQRIKARYVGKRKIDISGKTLLLREYQIEYISTKIQETDYYDENNKHVLAYASFPDGKGGKIIMRQQKTSREIALLNHPNLLDQFPDAKAMMIKGAFEKNIDDSIKNAKEKNEALRNWAYWVKHKLIMINAFKEFPKNPAPKQMISALDQFLKASNQMNAQGIDPKIIEATNLMKTVVRDSKDRWVKAENEFMLGFLNGFFYGYYGNWGGLIVDTVSKTYDGITADERHKAMVNDAQARMNKIRIEMSQKYGMKFIPLF